MVLPAAGVGFLAVLVGMTNPLFLGGGIGLLLALANVYASFTLSSKALTTSLVRSEAIILFGFLLRLTAVGFIFYGLSRIPALNIAAALITFLVGFTVMLVWEARFFLSMGAGVRGRRNL